MLFIITYLYCVISGAESWLHGVPIFGSSYLTDVSQKWAVYFGPNGVYNMYDSTQPGQSIPYMDSNVVVDGKWFSVARPPLMRPRREGNPGNAGICRRNASALDSVHNSTENCERGHFFFLMGGSPTTHQPIP